jgi:acyl carrier protein
VLNIERIGVTDNFFELGGQSLLAIQVINRLKSELSREISFSQFFKHPTILELSTNVQSKDYQPIPLARQEESYVLTSSQSRLWLLSQFEGGSGAYNMSIAVIMHGPLDFSKLELSFKFLLNRHEILRTNFRMNGNGEVRQYIRSLEDIEFNIEEKDFHDSTEQSSAVLDYLISKNNEVFDLSKGSLLRPVCFVSPR